VGETEDFVSSYSPVYFDKKKTWIDSYWSTQSFHVYFGSFDLFWRF